MHIAMVSSTFQLLLVSSCFILSHQTVDDAIVHVLQSWKFVDFLYPSDEARSVAQQQRQYVPEHVVILDSDWYFCKIFLPCPVVELSGICKILKMDNFRVHSSSYCPKKNFCDYAQLQKWHSRDGFRGDQRKKWWRTSAETLSQLGFIQPSNLRRTCIRLSNSCRISTIFTITDWCVNFMMDWWFLFLDRQMWTSVGSRHRSSRNFHKCKTCVSSEASDLWSERQWQCNRYKDYTMYLLNRVHVDI